MFQVTIVWHDGVERNLGGPHQTASRAFDYMGHQAIGLQAKGLTYRDLHLGVRDLEDPERGFLSREDEAA